MIEYVFCWHKFVEVSKSCEGGKEQGLQEQLGFTSTPFYFIFPHIHLHLHRLISSFFMKNSLPTLQLFML
jgi:hypothetical protein